MLKAGQRLVSRDGRSLALGRLLGRRQRADRRRPPPRRQEPSGGYRGGARRSCAARSRPSRRPWRRPRRRPRPPSRPRPPRAAAGARCSMRRIAARDQQAEAEREISRNAARLSALDEAAARLTASRDEAIAAARRSGPRARRAAAGRRYRERSSRACAARSKASARGWPRCGRKRRRLAREAEISARRLAAIAGDRRAWSERNESAVGQIKTLEARVEEARAERAGFEDAPRLFEEKRRALIDEIETAEDRPPRRRRSPRAKARPRSPKPTAPPARRSKP